MFREIINVDLKIYITTIILNHGVLVKCIWVKNIQKCVKQWREQLSIRNHL